MKVSTLWLKDYVDFSFSQEELIKIFDALGLSVVSWEEINGDSVIELEPFPHRFDTLGHVGIARQLAAAKDLPFKEPVFSPGHPEAVKGDLDIVIRNESMCPRCCGKIIYGLKNEASPDWMQQRLRSVGISPVDNIRDAAVYILLDMGQPVHIFSLKDIKGKQLIVRAARPKEKLVTRAGRKIELDKDMLIISDEDKCLSLAGLTDDPLQASFPDTQAAAVLAACFDPKIIRRARKIAGIQTESSKRYERGVDIDALPQAIMNFTSLLGPARDDTSQPATDVYPRPRKPKTVIIRQRKINEVLGIGVEESFFLSVLQRSGFKLNSQQKGSWRVSVPAFRPDIERETDLIEEIGRYYGYERIPPRLPQLDAVNPCRGKRNRLEDGIRQILFQHGYDEALNDNFMPPHIHELFAEGREPVPVLNPISSRTSFLKNTLLAGLLENMQKNFARGLQRIHLFEKGGCFFIEKDEIHEKKVLAFVSCGSLDSLHWQKKSIESDFFHVKGTCESILECAGLTSAEFDEADFPVYEPGYSLAVKVKGEMIGHLGMINHAVREAMGITKVVNAAEIDMKALTAKIPVSEFIMPVDMKSSIVRFLSFIDMQGIRYKDIKAAVEGLNLPGLESLDIIDRHVETSSEEEKVHICLKFVFNFPESDKRENQLNTFMQKIIQVCQNKFSFKLRKGGGD